MNVISETPTYPAPRNRLLRWLAAIGDDVPDEIQRRLRSAFFTSNVTLIVGALNSIAVASVAYIRSLDPLFAAIALCDLALLAVRIVVLRRTSSPSGPVFATGLLWAGLQGATISLAVLSGDLALSFLVLATGMASIGAIIGRNFAAPRYAMAQMLILDGSFKITFSLQHPEFLPIVVLQSVVFVLMNVSLVRQHRNAAIQAIRGEIESREKAFTDPLTGLGNRRALEEAFARMTSPMMGRALLYLDLDGFKQVNDRLGHAAGDRLLKEVGQRLRDTVGADATVCRLGGDEFLILGEGFSRMEARNLGARIIASIAVPYQIDESVFARVGASVGAVAGEPDCGTLTDLMVRADRALYAAKGDGKGRCLLHAEVSASRHGRPESFDKAAG